MYLVFDTETSGLPPKKPMESSHPEYPRILQMAAILLDKDFVEQGAFCFLIDIPDYVVINPDASAANGITKKKCRAFGVPIEVALLNLYAMIERSHHHIGHNISFDLQMVRREEEIIYGVGKTELPNPLCTMHICTPICKLENKWDRKMFKWPKLQEAYEFFFHKKFDKAHDALADVRATVELFKHLVNNRFVTLPSQVSQT